QLLQYAPDSCAVNYENTNEAFKHAFLIDPNKLGTYSEASLADADKMLKGNNSIFITKDSTIGNDANSSKILAQTTTYPRLVYAGADDSSLLGADIAGNLSAAEGIYIVGVKDSRTSTDKADYYDFYIRTCWYGVDSERPSTISTVIRLNDLDATKYDIEEGRVTYVTEGSDYGTVKGSYPSGTTSLYGQKVTLTATPIPGYDFLGWYYPNGDLYSKDRVVTYIIREKNLDLTAKFGIEIKVLNVYPDINKSNAQTCPTNRVPAGTQMPSGGCRSDALKDWMDKWGINEEGNQSRQLTVEPVRITDFNADPYKYLGSRGNWNYDIIVFGFWDVNNSRDLNTQSAAAMRDFLTNNGKALFGHDTFHSGTCTSHPYFKSLEDLAGLECDNFGWTATDKVKIVKEGVFTQRPYYIGGLGTILTIPLAHRTQFKTKGTVWLRFNNLPDKADNTNFYLASYGNTAYINTGHSGGLATDDERKIIANVLFYLYQLGK
ncbi:hypothetical protein IKE72_00255, partial [Candidatus Saccharibacteria bacterium]|nr:hypothetical protein [Candidatus Saccharibacteria bacterium]